MKRYTKLLSVMLAIVMTLSAMGAGLSAFAYEVTTAATDVTSAPGEATPVVTAYDPSVPIYTMNPGMSGAPIYTLNPSLTAAPGVTDAPHVTDVPGESEDAPNERPGDEHGGIHGDDLLPDENEDLKITARTLANKENMYVKYAVPHRDRDVKMLFWTEEQEEYTVDNATEDEVAVYQDHVNGELCNIFQFTDMKDHQMTDVLYARAYTIVDGEYVYGEVNKYSILQYAYNKMHEENVDEALKETLDDMLDRGAEEQRRKNYKTDDLANAPHKKIHVVEDLLSDGFQDLLLPENKEFTGFDRYTVESGSQTFYFEFGNLVTGYCTIESSIYYFDADHGAKKNMDFDGHFFDRFGKMKGDREFVNVNGNTYYLIAEIIVYNYYVIDERVYYFGDNGVMRKDEQVGDHYFDENGALEGDSVFIDNGKNVYYIVNNIVVYVYIYVEEILYLQVGDMYYPTTEYDSAIQESDNDEDVTNNESLDGVTCIATIEDLGISFTVTSDENGNFNFPHLPKMEISIKFVFEGYIETNIVVDINKPEEKPDRIILDRDVSNTLNGRVTIADTDTNFGNNQSLEGARVTIDRISSTNPFTATTTTDAEGNYTFGDLTAGVYKLVVVIENYIIVNQTIYVRHNETNIQNAPIEAIPDDGNHEPGAAAGTIVDARTAQAVAGVKVHIRAGLNNTTGEIIKTVITDANGNYHADDLAPGNYTAQVVDDRELANEDLRFGTLVIVIKVMAQVVITNQNATVSNNAGLDIDGMRVVLTWGEYPHDLDSHMQIDLNNGRNFHVYFGDKQGLDTDLDVDDTSSYGPETVTVRSVGEGVYTYYIHRWSSDGELRTSGAKVEVYLGSAAPAYTFYVPNGYGIYWNVFTYNSVTGEFTVVNTITDSPVIP